MKREEGYYWILNIWDIWLIAEYCDDQWWVTGSEVAVNEKNSIERVGPRIEPPEGEEG